MIIIDSSVAYKWFTNNEKDRDIALALLTAHLTKKDKIVTLDLLVYELINAWSTKTALNIDEIHTNIREFHKYLIKEDHLSTNQLKEVVRMCKKYKVSGYDAAYAVLAKSYVCNLITADRKFVNKVKLPFIKLLKD